MYTLNPKWTLKFLDERKRDPKDPTRPRPLETGLVYYKVEGALAVHNAAIDNLEKYMDDMPNTNPVQQSIRIGLEIALRLVRELEPPKRREEVKDASQRFTR